MVWMGWLPDEPLLKQPRMERGWRGHFFASRKGMVLFGSMVVGNTPSQRSALVSSTSCRLLASESYRVLWRPFRLSQAAMV